MEKFDPITQSMFVFAARYAHTRQTGAALAVVRSAKSNWDRLDDDTKHQLIREAGEATCNFEDWDELKGLEV